jgi:hypothetical protein
MSVNTHLYLNPKWTIKDVCTVLENHFELEEKTITKTVIGIKSFQKIKTEITWDIVCPDCFYIRFTLKGSEPRNMFVVMGTQTPLGIANYLDLEYNDEAVMIMKKIASVLGGVFEENDCDGEKIFMDGMFNDHNGLPYFLKYAILHGEMKDEDDILGFIASIKKWEDTTRTHGREKIVKGDLLSIIK